MLIATVLHSVCMILRYSLIRPLLLQGCEWSVRALNTKPATADPTGASTETEEEEPKSLPRFRIFF